MRLPSSLSAAVLCSVLSAATASAATASAAAGSASTAAAGGGTATEAGEAGGSAPSRGQPGTSAGTAIRPSDFPSTATIKDIMAGSRTWYREFSRDRPLGARPSACRSDRPFAQATEFRSAWYGGPLRDTRSVWGSNHIDVHRFASTAAAKRAIANVKRFVTDCPRSVEWVCTNCDGIATTTRSPAAPRRVGTESVAWRERADGMGVASNRVIASRSGRTVVVAVSGHQSSPEDPSTPRAPRWAQADAVARAALRAAT